MNGCLQQRPPAEIPSPALLKPIVRAITIEQLRENSIQLDERPFECVIVVRVPESEMDVSNAIVARPAQSDTYLNRLRRDVGQPNI